MLRTLFVALIMATLIPFAGCGKSGETTPKAVKQPSTEGVEQPSIERKEAVSPSLEKLSESEATARKELEQSNIPWSAENFTKQAESGDIRAVELFLEGGMSPEAKDISDRTAIGNAAYKGHIDIVKLLLEHGVNANITGKQGRTALMDAALGGHTDIVKLLLEHGADVNAKTADGNTVLMNATYGGKTEIVQLLKEAGAKE